jgi:signal peptidase I
MNEQTQREPSSNRSRRVAAVLFAIFGGPAVGYFSIGHRRRALIWYGAGVVAASLFISSVALGSPHGMWGLLAVVAAVYFLFVPIDVWRRRLGRVPRWRHVVLVLTGALIFSEFVVLRLMRRTAEAFQIPAAAMYPTLMIGDHIMTTKLPRKFRRGDVAVFKYPLEPEVTYVKRVVAVGGDTVEMRDGVLTINEESAGSERTETQCSPVADASPCSIWRETMDGRSYLIARDDEPRHQTFAPVQVPPGHYFLLGDNRDNSSDSRMWGTVPSELMVGRATFIWWSSSASGPRWERINSVLH